jgi:hypothetical protein
MASYRRGRIEAEIPLIRHVSDHVEFSPQNAAEVRASGEPNPEEVADLVERLLEVGPRKEGQLFKVFLLTRRDDPGTAILGEAIPNDAVDANGRTTAWVQLQRYASLSGLQTAHTTTQILER